MRTVVLITGGFDPIHPGHIEYITGAKKLGDILILGLNSDSWLIRKKGRFFQGFHSRKSILSHIREVDYIIDFDDTDDSAKDAIRMVRQSYPGYRIIFGNGGDRTSENIPEMGVIDDNLEFAFGLGGEAKLDSSSCLLEEWRAPKTMRPWGYYRVLYEISTKVKVKELTVMPGERLSKQRHFNRSEYWFVTEGTGVVYMNDSTIPKNLGLYETFVIPPKKWHQLANETLVPLRMVELQYGTSCREEDIERDTREGNRMLTKSEVEAVRQDLKNSIGMLGKLESQNEQL